MKKDPNATALAAACTTALLYVLCRVAVEVAPDFMFSVGQSWFHTIQFTKMQTWNVPAGSFVLGLVSSSATAWLVGYVFALFYNTFLPSKKR